MERITVSNKINSISTCLHTLDNTKLRSTYGYYINQLIISIQTYYVTLQNLHALHTLQTFHVLYT